jgi:rare lipoprotein A (peptidoglycan hydrolase)
MADFWRWLAGVLLALLTAVQPLSAPEPAWGSIYATYYGPGLWGRHTADGTILRRDSIWVASNSLPLGSWVIVRVGNRSLLLQVKDRHGRGKADFLDLTQAAADWLHHRYSGPVEWRLP